MTSLGSRGSDADVVIVGAGIGGLTLALCLERARIACRVYEAAADWAPLIRSDSARWAAGLQARRHQGRVTRRRSESRPLEKP